jgi:hypothetical protein
LFFKTLATVGYGDFSPVSNFGKVAVCIAILVSLWLIPYHLSTSLDRFKAWKGFLHSPFSILHCNIVCSLILLFLFSHHLHVSLLCVVD